MMSERSVSGVLFLVAVILRVLALAILGLPPEAFEHEDLSLSLLAGQGYQRILFGTVHRSQERPPFAFLCAGIYALTAHSQIAVILVQIVLSSLIPIVIYRIGRLLSLPPNLGIVAAAVPLIHPGLIVYSVKKLHPLSMDALLISVTFLLILRLSDARGPRPFLTAGGVLGLTILSRPTIGAFGLVAVGWLVTRQGELARRRVVGYVGLLAFSAALVFLPWTVRNYVIHHRIIFVTTDIGELFWRGNNPQATGTAYLMDRRPMFEGAPAEFKRAIYERDELAQNDLFLAAGLDFVRNQPRQFVGLLITKWLSFWWFPSTAGGLYPPVWLLLYQGFYLILLLLFMVGLPVMFAFLKRGGRAGVLLLLLLFLSVSIAQSLFYVDVRHRWIVEPLMGILAAHGIRFLANQARTQVARASTLG